MRRFHAGDRVKISVVCDYGGVHWVESEVVAAEGETTYTYNSERFINVRSPTDWTEVTAVTDDQIRRIK